MPKTLYDKLVDSHTVRKIDAETVLLYVDFHIMNEYTSPQAFAGLHAADRPVWRSDAHLAVVDHVNPTRRIDSLDDIADVGGRLQIETLVANCRRHGIELFDFFDPRQGIEHVVVPENGFPWPGMVIACGDSHTTTYGAFGALGFGIGTSEIEHVLATQTIQYQRLKPMRIEVRGQLAAGVMAKDLIMHVVARIGAAGAVGHAIEFTGTAIADMHVEGRMTICNMAVEAGARAAIIAPDATVLDYLKDRPRAPRGAALDALRRKMKTLHSDPGADFAQDIVIDAAEIQPLVTWGTSPDQAIGLSGRVPVPTSDPARRALDYMGLEAGQLIRGTPIDRAFIGSCTNARLGDLRAAAAVLRGRRAATGVTAIVVPGSRQVKAAAEAEGIDRIFRDAGFEWRDAGCSMCLAMNDDVAASGERCAS